MAIILKDGGCTVEDSELENFIAKLNSKLLSVYWVFNELGM